MYQEDDALGAYEWEAEDRYHDYDSEEYHEDEYDDYWDEEDDFGGLEGLDDAYDGYFEDEIEEVEYLPMYDDGDDAFDSYAPSNIGRIDPNDRTLTVVATNGTGADLEMVIFGANQGLNPPAGATVTVEESSHNEVREESKSNPFKIVGMKMSVSDNAQFDNILRISRRTASGKNDDRVYQPRNATSPQNFTPNLIDDAGFEMDVTGQDAIRVVVKNGVTITFTFTIKARANMGNLLLGKNVAELSAAPRTTGLPQIDLLRQKKPTAFGVKPKKKKAVKKVVRRRVPAAKSRRPVPRRRPAPRRKLTRRR